MKQQIINSVEKCLNWVETQMLTFDRGSCGVYERIRIDINQRVCWTRPDCTAEMARVLLTHKEVNGDESRTDIYNNFINWLLKVQNDSGELSIYTGGFPFYLIDGWITGSEGTWQNDNGKILICLLDMYEKTGDERLLASARKLADYWVRRQNDLGTYYFYDKNHTQGVHKGPCMIFWMIAGIAQLGGITKDAKYIESARKALDYVLPLQHENGRFTTTYEIHKSEDWRPVSSEAAIGVFCLAKVMKYDPADRVLKALKGVLDFTLTLQDEGGAVMNCSADSMGASLQEDPDLCDLVYTEGFALMGFVEAYKVLGDVRSLEAAKKLAGFLMRIQCQGESHLWDGAWRGAYNVRKGCWSGRANQNNDIDEGGMYSVYTGWCNTTIMQGMLELEKLL